MNPSRPADELIREIFDSRIERRRFLKASAGGVALLGLGAMLPAGCRSYPKAEIPLRFFTSKEYAIVNAVAPRLLGAEGHIGRDANQVDVAAYLDAAAATWDVPTQRQLRTILRVFEHGTYLFDLQRKRFTRLSAAQQDQYLAGWMSSTLGARRSVFRALKAMVAAGYYQDPRTWSRLGYDGPWLGRVHVPETAPPETAVSLQTLLKPLGS